MQLRIPKIAKNPPAIDIPRGGFYDRPYGSGNSYTRGYYRSDQPSIDLHLRRDASLPMQAGIKSKALRKALRIDLEADWYRAMNPVNSKLPRVPPFARKYIVAQQSLLNKYDCLEKLSSVGHSML